MIPLLIILTGVLCGALPTVLWWRERKERLSCEGRLSWFRIQLRADGREKVAWRLFMKKLAKQTNIAKNCKECGKFFKLTQTDLLGRDIPEHCPEHRLRNKAEHARRQREAAMGSTGIYSHGDPENMRGLMNQLGVVQDDAEYMKEQRRKLRGQ